MLRVIIATVITLFAKTVIILSVNVVNVVAPNNDRDPDNRKKTGLTLTTVVPSAWRIRRGR
jgi:hypothetical protein